MAREGSSRIDWERVRDEAATHLQQIIRCDTTNPPGNEMLAVEYLRSIFEAEGIACQVYESAPGRGNIFARLKGSGKKKPLLLLSHLDVVPAEASKWQVPPFSGETKDGCLWGRGAVDMKGMTAMELMVILLLKRQGVKLDRDVTFLASADEEMGGRMGVVWIVENHPELVDCEYCLSESGGQALDINGKRLYLCQVSEKGGAGVRLVAKGSPGHASVPKDDNAIIKLAEALTHIQPRSMPVHLTKTVRTFVEEVAEAYQGKERETVLDLLDPEKANEALAHFPEPRLADMFSAILRNTATPTVLRAGEKTNVIPSEAEAILDCRALPGYGPDDVQREVRALIPDVDVEVAPRAPGVVPLTYELGTDNDLFKAISATIGELDPGARVVPHMLSGATDQRFLIRRGVTAYGFGPIMRPEAGISAFHGLAHAHDERIPVDNLGFGSRVLFEVVKKVCC